MLKCIHYYCCTVVEGRSERAVADAKRRLEMVVWSNRLRERITHFISIPLNHPTLMERLKAFQKEVMDKCSKVRNSTYWKIGFSYEVSMVQYMYTIQWNLDYLDFL